MHWPLHQQFMRGSTDVRLYFLVNKVKYALDEHDVYKWLDEYLLQSKIK